MEEMPTSPLSSPQPPKEGKEAEERTPPCMPCCSLRVLDELQFLLKPPPTTLPFHLVLEAAKELPGADQQSIIQPLSMEEAP